LKDKKYKKKRTEKEQKRSLKSEEKFLFEK